MAKDWSSSPLWRTAVEAGQTYGIDPAIIMAQIMAESGGRTNAVSPAGARGVSQFMPATARAEGVNPDDPVSSIYGQARLMSRYMKQYGSLANALVAYNAGPGRVGKALPEETKGYIANFNRYMEGGGVPVPSGSPSGGAGGIDITTQLLEDKRKQAEKETNDYIQNLAIQQQAQTDEIKRQAEEKQRIAEQSAQDSIAASQQKVDMAATAPEALPSEPAPAPEPSFLDSLSKGLSPAAVGEDIKQLGAGALASPYTVVGNLFGWPLAGLDAANKWTNDTLIGMGANITPYDPSQSASQPFFDLADFGQRSAQKTMGLAGMPVGAPEGYVQRLARDAPGNLAMAGKALPAAIIGGVQEGWPIVNDFLGSLFNKTPEEKGAEPLSAQQTADTRSLMTDPLAASPLSGGGLAPTVPPKQGFFGPIQNPLDISARAAETGSESILKGPPLISDKLAFEAIGWPALITAGFGLLGYGAKGLKNWTGKPRPYLLDPSIAPPGTMSAMTQRDYAAGMFQNVWAPLNRLFKLPGVNMDMARNAKLAMLETRATGIGGAYGAAEKGRADMVAGTVSVKTPLSLLRKMEIKNPDLSTYVWYKDILDRMVQMRVGFVDGKNRTWYYNQLRALVQKIKPDQLNKYTKGYQENLAAMRNYGPGHVGSPRSQLLFSTGGKVLGATVGRTSVTGAPLLHPRTKVPLTRKIKLVVPRPFEVPHPLNIEAPGELPMAAATLYDKMVNHIRNVNDNEAKLRTVDAIRTGKNGDKIMNKGDADTYKRNKDAYDKGTVIVWRNGEKEYYHTDPAYADILRVDPYYPSGLTAQTFGTIQRTLTNAMTGPLSWFGLLGNSFLRGFTMSNLGVPSTLGQVLSRDPYRRSQVGPLAGVMAIGRELGPKAMWALSQSFEASLASADYKGLWNMISPQKRQNIANLLAAEYHKSLIGLVEETGTGQAGGSFMDIGGNKAKLSQLDRAGEMLPRSVRSTWRAYVSMLHASHGSNSAAYVFKNMRLIAKRVAAEHMRKGIPRAQAEQLGKEAARKELPLLTSEAANLAGNPRIEGQSRIATDRKVGGLGGGTRVGGGGERWMSGPGKPANPTIGQRVAGALGETTIPWGAGAVGQGLREGVPYGNSIIQSMTALGQAYLHDPAMFTLRLWTYVLAPATANYLWNKSMNTVKPDGTPGDDITDYQMRGRSVYNTLVNMWVANPGSGPNKRAERGWELSGPPEISLLRYMWEVFLHHQLSTSPQMFTTAEDLQNGMGAFMPIAVIPPASTAESIYAITRGDTPPPNMGADMMRPHKVPFPEPGSVPEWIDHTVRAFGGQMLHTMMLAYASMNDSYRNSEDGGMSDIMSMMGAGLEEMKRSFLQGGPLTQALAPDVLRPRSVDTWTNREYRKNKEAIDNLNEYWKDVGQYTEDPEDPRNPKLNVDRAEQSGTEEPSTAGTFNDKIDEGKELPRPGRLPVAPINELYHHFAAQVKEQLMSNAKSDSVTGFMELVGRRAILVQAIDGMKGITEGYAPTWLKRVQSGEEGPDLKEMFKTINPKNRNSAIKIMNNWMDELQQINGEYVKAVRKTEDLMSQETTTPEFKQQYGLPPDFKGWNIRLKDLDPYIKWTVDKKTGRITDSSGRTIKILPEYAPREHLE